MPRPALPATATLALLLAAGATAAQPPTAPPPHPTLDELVREYRRLGLPEPPRDAEIVRFEYRGGESDRFSFLAFKAGPIEPNRRPRYWVGGQIWAEERVGLDWEAPVSPGAESARGLAPGSGYMRLILAIQCQAHGRPELARALYDMALSELWDGTDGRSAADETPIEILRDEAWGFWGVTRLNEPGADRREPLRRLRSLTAVDARFRTEMNLELVSDLGFTIDSPPAQPGTVEALIDSLMEYSGDASPYVGGQPPHPGYWRLVDLGFDAVPALLNHLNDRRVTRWYVWLGGKAMPFRARIGYVAAEILGQLAGHDERGRWNPSLGKVDAEKARRWWADARTVGEEKWLLGHVTPPESVEPWSGLNEQVLRVIRVKYPGRLPDLYRTLLRREQKADTGACVREIRASTLPRAQQIALLEEGARHALFRHRFFALEGLGQLDPARVRQPTLQLLQTFQPQAAGADQDGPWPDALVTLTNLSGDRQCWDALAAVAPKLPAEDRRELIWALGRDPKPDPNRKERLRILVAMLGDQSRIEDHDDRLVFTSHVGDHAADRLALLLGFRPRGEDWEPEFDTVHERGALSRLILRAAVWQAAEREFSQPDR